MRYQDYLKPRNLFIAAILLILTILSFIIRSLPAYSGNPDALIYVGMDDPTYQLRRIEQVIAHYPNVAWFDPMTYFPYGQPMHWGPLFPFICATVCLLAGVTTRPEFISVALFVPCAMAALLVPILYLLVSRIADWKAGIAAAFFISIVSGQFFFRSFYGYLDHHIGEVLFSTIFCLCYVYALVYCRKHPVDLTNRETWKIPIVLGILCGITYVIGLSLMPTMILFALLVGMFAPIWFIIQRYIGHLGASALVINTVTFLIAIVGFFIIGVHAEGGLNYYTIGHPVAYGLLIGGNLILFAVSYLLKEKPFWHYVLAILGVSVTGIVLFALLLPENFSYLLNNAIGFFGSEDVHWQTIREARPWTLDLAWGTFQYGLLLFCTGIIILLYRIRKELCPSHTFILLWSLVILYATCQHVRYEYYMAVPVAILAGITVGFVLDLGGIPGIKSVISPEKPGPVEKTPGKKRSGKRSARSPSHARLGHPGPGKAGSLLLLIIILVISILFSYFSIERNLLTGYNLNPDWRETTEWIANNTPDPGIDYTGIYEKENWTYPKEAYGVMSWWDYGHIITLLGKRLPNANPFQYGVDGPNGSATYVLCQDEKKANRILDNLSSRYVIVDNLMAIGYLNSIATWANPEVGMYPYSRIFILADRNNPKSGQDIPFYTQEYYQTMVSRLYNFDGSYTEPENVYYLRYMTPSASGLPYPLVVNGTQTTYSQGKTLMDSFKTNQNPDYEDILVNINYTETVAPLPALKQYRLIYESKTRTTPPDMPDLRFVKVYEYVKGARIPGEGMLELTVKTNTGREFVYRTESVNGTFVVPYPTTSTVGAVTIPGRYKNMKTGTEYAVTEEQIMKGDQIR